MNQIAHIRKHVLKLTQGELAQIAQVSQATVSRWETGGLSPSLTEAGLIRDEARRRRCAWDDRLFFEAEGTPRPRRRASRSGAAA